MKVVSENSEAELRKNRATEGLRWPLKELTANLIRVTRGAGKAYEIPRQLAKALDAIADYREAVGHLPSDYEMSEAISIRHLNSGKPTDEIHDAIDVMVQGALQIAASQLLSQSTQEAAGERELLDGVGFLEAARELNRKRRD